MRFKGLDLNLLIALRALLEERSVSAAAERLNISQPGMSASLKRLREYFNDDMLQASGKRMVPTSHALHIEPKLQQILADLDVFVSQTTIFDPETSNRNFVITASDYIATVVIAPLIPKLMIVAPNVTIQVVPPADSTVPSIQQGKIDVAILPNEFVYEDLPKRFLMTEKFVVVGCAKNEMLDRKFTTAQFAAAPHVLVRLGRLSPRSVAETKLEMAGIGRNVRVEVSSFTVAPQMIVNTPLISVMHERLALKFAEHLPIKIVDLPFEMEPMLEYLYYNNAREDDPGLNWLLDLLQDEVKITMPDYDA